MFSEGPIAADEAALREHIATKVQARLGGSKIIRSAPNQFTMDTDNHSGAPQGAHHLRTEEWHWELQDGLFLFHLAASEALGWLERYRVETENQTNLALFQRYWELALVAGHAVRERVAHLLNRRLELGIEEGRVSMPRVAGKMKRRAKSSTLAAGLLNALVIHRADVQPLINARNDFVHGRGMSVFQRHYISYDADCEFEDPRSGKMMRGRSWGFGGDPLQVKPEVMEEILETGWHGMKACAQEITDLLDCSWEAGDR